MQLPTEIRISSARDALTLSYGDLQHTLDAEFLRVYSPSAEVRGHGRGQEKLQTGKRGVLIEDISPAGNYALKIRFSDGHDSGLFDWDYLYRLGSDREAMWQDYLARLAAAGASRDVDSTPAKKGKNCGGCGGH